MRVSFLLLLCFVTVSCNNAPTPIEEYSLKLANCLAQCSDRPSSCASQCTLYKACSGPNVCALRCPPADADCHHACQTFSVTPDCDRTCTSQTLRVRSGLGLTYTASSDTEHPHVLLLDLYKGVKYYTVTSEFSTLKVDVYPGKLYRFRAIIFSDGGCCTEGKNHKYRIHFNSSIESEFSLAPDLVKLFSDSEMYLDKNKEPVLFPRIVGYDTSKDNGYSYVSSGNLKSITDLSSYLRFQRSDLGAISADEMSITRPFLLGAGYVVTVFADTDRTVSFYDKDINRNKMIPQEARFCTFVPNVSPAPASLEPKGGCVTMSGQYATYQTSTDLSNIQSCFRTARKSNGAIEHIPCCEDKDTPPFLTHPNNTVCLRFEGDSNKAQFNRDYDYLIYLKSDHNSGLFERLNPSTWHDVSESECGTWLVVWVIVTVTACVVIVCAVVGWYYRKTIVTKLLILHRT